MDGSGQTTLVSTKGYANSLTLDEDRRRLYWVETTSGCIASSDLNGNAKIVVVRDLGKPGGLALYKDNMYWTDDAIGKYFSTFLEQFEVL